MDYYIQGDAARAKEIKAAFEAKGCTLYRLASNCDSEDLIYYSLNGIVRGIKKDNLYLFEAHPGYEELKLPNKPQFKVGDWVVVKNGGNFSSNNYVEQITMIKDDGKHKLIWLTSKTWVDDDYIRLWTIEDAKDGDVLACSDWLFILKQFNVKGNNHKTYCHYDLTLNRFKDDTDSYMVSGSDEFHPANKVQRALFFAKMKESGYEWDAEKKELKKVTVKPMFKVGDWVVSTREPSLTYRILESNVTNELGELDYKVEIYSNGIYEKTCFIASNKMDEWGHLWTIQDAKDGDVLVDTLSGTRALTILFISINEDDSISAYCGWNGYTFRVTIDGLGYGTLSSTRYVPATQEQCDWFFKKMQEAGYQWDSEKKELEKIKSHYNIENFHAGMPVLVRDMEGEQWTYTTYSHYDSSRGYKFMTSACQLFVQCIPFEGNEHLLGTTDMCDGQYINW